MTTLAGEIEAAFHPRVFDLTDTAAIIALVRSVESEISSVDTLIDNAGVVSASWLEDTSADQIERTFRVNALAPIHLTRLLLSGMLARNRGHVMTIASAAGIAGTARLVDYSASKAVQGAARSEWLSPFTRAGTPPWTLTGQPSGRSCGAALRRSRDWKGERPFPAHGALQLTAWRLAHITN